MAAHCLPGPLCVREGRLTCRVPQTQCNVEFGGEVWDQDAGGRGQRRPAIRSILLLAVPGRQCLSWGAMSGSLPCEGMTGPSAW